jgi:hypothetical protein
MSNRAPISSVALPAPHAELEWSRLQPGLDFPPECIDAGVPLVGYLLEGLVSLLLHDLEPSAGKWEGPGRTAD